MMTVKQVMNMTLFHIFGRSKNESPCCLARVRPTGLVNLVTRGGGAILFREVRLTFFILLLQTRNQILSITDAVPTTPGIREAPGASPA